MTNLGVLYANGQGVPQDYAKAREWYEKAAAAGDAAAMRNLGFLYANGQGVPQDYAKAREWYEKAAAQAREGTDQPRGAVSERTGYTKRLCASVYVVQPRSSPLAG